MRYLHNKHQEYLGYFSTIPSYTHHEGDAWGLSSEDQPSPQYSYDEISSQFSVKNDEVPYLTPDKIRKRLDEAAQDMARQLVEKTTSAIKKSATEAGTAIDAGGKTLSMDMVLESLGKLEWAFEDDGTPHKPALLLHPELWEKTKDDFAEWEANSIFQQRYGQIAQQKWDEWRVRESNRKLVD